MKSIMKKISMAFSAGALGGFVNGLAVWLSGYIGFTTLMQVMNAPQLTPPYLYGKIVWGGIWGLLLLIPIFTAKKILRTVCIGIPPILGQLFVVFPFKLNAGYMGLQLGALTPVLVVVFDLVYAAVAVYSYSYVSDEHA